MPIPSNVPEAAYGMIHLHLTNMEMRGYRIQTRDDGNELRILRPGERPQDEIQIAFRAGGKARVQNLPGGEFKEETVMDSKEAYRVMNRFMQNPAELSLKELGFPSTGPDGRANLEIVEEGDRAQGPQGQPQEMGPPRPSRDEPGDGPDRTRPFPPEAYDAIRRAARRYCKPIYHADEVVRPEVIGLDQIAHLTPRSKYNRFLMFQSRMSGKIDATYKDFYRDEANPTGRQNRCKDFPPELIAKAMDAYAQDFEPVDLNAMAEDWRKRQSRGSQPAGLAKLPERGAPNTHAPKGPAPQIPIEARRAAARGRVEWRESARETGPARREWGPDCQAASLITDRKTNSHRFLDIISTKECGFVIEYHDHHLRGEEDRFWMGDFPEDKLPRLIKEFSRGSLRVAQVEELAAEVREMPAGRTR